MSFKVRGRERRGRGRPPIRGREQGEAQESPRRKGSETRTDVATPPPVALQQVVPPTIVPPQAAPPPQPAPPQQATPKAAPPSTIPAAGVDPTTRLMWESLQILIHTMMVTQQANPLQEGQTG